MSRILIAQKINRLVGGIAVLPWELDLIPEEWMMAFRMMSDDLPDLHRGMQRLDSAFDQAKAKFNRRQ